MVNEDGRDDSGKENERSALGLSCGGDDKGGGEAAKDCPGTASLEFSNSCLRSLPKPMFS